MNKPHWTDQMVLDDLERRVGSPLGPPRAWDWAAFERAVRSWPEGWTEYKASLRGADQ